MSYKTPYNKKGIAENNVIDSKDYYKYTTNIAPYYRYDQKMQFLPNIIQTNRRDIKLPDTDVVNIESELWGITRNLSKVPQARYLGPKSCDEKYNDKGICVCKKCLKSNVVNANNKESKEKIINNREKPNFSDCYNRRTNSNDSKCKNNVYKEQTILDYLKSFFI